MLKLTTKLKDIHDVSLKYKFSRATDDFILFLQESQNDAANKLTMPSAPPIIAQCVKIIE